MSWQPIETAPKIGQKLVAIYEDGSGAALLYRTDDGYIDSDGDDYSDFLDGFSIWAPLSPDFKFWCEIRSEDVFTLIPPAPTEGDRS